MNPVITAFVECITDTSEEKVLKLLEPVNDRKEMGEIYKETLGYDPIIYFDEKDIRQKLVDIVNGMSATARSKVQNHYDEIVEATLIGLDETRMENIESVLNAAIRNIVDDDEIDVMLAERNYEEELDVEDYPDFEEEVDVDNIDLSELEDIDSDDDYDDDRNPFDDEE